MITNTIDDDITHTLIPHTSSTRERLLSALTVAYSSSVVAASAEFPHLGRNALYRCRFSPWSSIQLEYKDLDAASRLSVWNNFLTSHNAAQAAARLSPPPKAPTTAAKSYGSARALNKCRTNSATPSAANGTTISAEAASKATRAGLMSSKTSFIFFHSTSGKAFLVSKSPSTMCYSGLLGPERLGAYRCRR
ncbi:unnamed protein product [Zymoseptoria tritici ST99CH_1A5]|uniref:Uncharacterized protein n=2 Tax=Zymoseptoria tritici TaxID=1047171 RepID=A0A2H1H8S8_ZYMTR|nr:unnamed protein product [Zymoseptoria tritici ST99CH_1E4]SMR64714.1 unnamed protein product [Zymoseptoria tritici ST99CH_3D1]SMY30052.1 unnamed protein product [Zymoseptoria tritici ST99CH_1A5]